MCCASSITTDSEVRRCKVCRCKVCPLLCPSSIKDESEVRRSKVSGVRSVLSSVLVVSKMKAKCGGLRSQV
jgi:hypothetical protein